MFDIAAFWQCGITAFRYCGIAVVYTADSCVCAPGMYFVDVFNVRFFDDLGRGIIRMLNPLGRGSLDRIFMNFCLGRTPKQGVQNVSIVNVGNFETNKKVYLN